MKEWQVWLYVFSIFPSVMVTGFLIGNYTLQIIGEMLIILASFVIAIIVISNLLEKVMPKNQRKDWDYDDSL